MTLALKSVLETLDGVHESLHAEYTKGDDGKFHLTVDGMVPKGRLDEFRDNNVTLKRQADEMKALYDGVDPAKYREMTEQATKIAEKKLIEAGKVEELFEARISPMRTEHEKLLKAARDEAATGKKQLEGLLIDSALRDAAGKAGVLPTAVEDVLFRGRAAFRLHEGTATAFEGDKPVFGKDGNPLSINEWATSLAEVAPHLFTPSQGGGSNKSQNANGNGKKQITRAQYDALAPADRMAAVKGMEVID